MGNLLDSRLVHPVLLRSIPHACNQGGVPVSNLANSVHYSFLCAQRSLRSLDS